MRSIALVASSIAIMLASGCSALEPVPPPPQEVVIRVTSDPGKPIEDANLLYNGTKVATTNAEGVGTLRLKGKDGETYDITVSCPEEFQSPAKPIPVVVRRLVDSSKKPEYAVACPPKVRTIVVAVRADGGANLPVMYQGREQARTDAAGAAHVMLKLKHDESFNLMLDTTSNDRLQPQNPVASFVVKDQDEVFTFDQKFSLEKRRYVAGPRRKGPIKIGH